ncbi:MAG: hypothetical protein LUG99_21310 [Lachnospiraceae bacterium]|nr:hypothetical protein [Lachnospiraceae bacterium]
MENISSVKEMAIDLVFTEEELKELDEARLKPITFDEDCPETTPEKALKFKRVNPRHSVGA